MKRVAALILLTATLLVAQEPNKVPSPLERQPRPKSGAEPVIPGYCACPAYPVYQEGDNVLYYANVCEAGSCSLEDVGYFWGQDVPWPLECQQNNEEQCTPCYAAKGKDFATLPCKDAPESSIAGINAKIFPNAHAINVLPESVQSNGVSSFPSKGVISDYVADFFVSFKEKDQKKYAKLFIVRVNDKGISSPQNANKDVLLYLGYEVDQSAVDMRSVIQLNNKDDFPSAKRYTCPTRGQGKASEYVKNVKAGRGSYLVLLQKPVAKQ